MVSDAIPFDLPATNDLRSTKAAFIKGYVAKLNKEEDEGANSKVGPQKVLTKTEKYAAGLQAWMSSKLRSVLSSGKAKAFADVRI